MSSDDTRVVLRTVLDQLVGRMCLGVLAGAGTGGTIHLEFGAPVPRRTPISNAMLSPEPRAFEGEFDLFVECAWRLEEGGHVLCGSTDDDRNDGPMVRGLSQLEHTRVEAVGIAQPVPDLTVQFSGDRRLRIFCDQADVAMHIDSYSLRSGDTIIAVGPRGRIEVERRASDA